MKSILRHIRNILVPYYRHEPKVRDAEINCPVYVFYHIYCGKGDWKSILNEQVGLIQSSELINNIDIYYLTIIGTNDDKEYVLNRFPLNKVEIVHFSQDGSCFEFPCLQKMQELSEAQKFYALYFHTKGSSYDINRFKDDISEYKSVTGNVVAWRNLMNYYNIVKWQMAISSLNNGFSTYGCLLMEEHRNVMPHYSGNFWWTTSDNCLNSPKITDSYRADRWNAEQWIINSKSRPYCAFYCYVLLYGFEIKNSTWLKPWWHKSNLSYAITHWREGRKHLLY